MKAPAKPEKLAPSENASSFVVTVLMPIAAAAVSSSRMAIQARPSFESRRRTQIRYVIIQQREDQVDQDAIGFWLENTIWLPHGPGIGIVGGSIGLMPDVATGQVGVRADQDRATEEGRQGQA